MTTGLRERKKQLTREHISNIATALFIDRGYEATTISDVAEAAQVAKMTVTNYFALKEDLVFDRGEAITGLWANAVADRAPGTAALDALREHHLRCIDAHEPVLGFIGLPFARLVESSAALVSRERALLGAQEDRLARVLTNEFATSPADLRPKIAAAQLAGLARVLYYEGRRRLLAGETTAQIAAALRRAVRQGYAAIEPTLPSGYRA